MDSYPGRIHRYGTHTHTALLWVWIVYEMHIAPEIDDEHIKIDITEEDINDDLNCQYEGEDKEVL